MINVFQPQLGEEEVNAVREVFKSNWIGKGKKTEQFEHNMANYLGVDSKHIRSASCCTASLFLITKFLNIKDGDEVIMPTISFVGAANPIGDAGAKIVFCDVDTRSLNVTLSHIQEKVTAKTKAVILIHYGGVPVADMSDIIEYCKEKNIVLIEDNACSVSSVYNGKHCGTLGDFGAFSFDAMKILVMGDGAIVYSKNPLHADRIEKLGYLGLESQSGISNKIDNKWWEFEISCYGSREIINDISAAIGIEQLKKLDGFIARRKEIHEIYNRELSKYSWMVLPPDIADNVKSSYYFYWIQTNRRDALAKHLKNDGIYTTFRYYPLHKVPYYKCSNIKLPNAEKASDTTLCLPIHQSLSNDDMDKIINSIEEFSKHE